MSTAVTTKFSIPATDLSDFSIWLDRGNS